MRYWLLDILACPMCKGFPLQLHVFEERVEETSTISVEEIPCEVFCGYKRKKLDEVNKEEHRKVCEECMRHVIVSGLLVCPNCGRWYPIIDEIPHMLPDKLRDKNKDMSFLAKYKDRIPAEILEKGKPYHL